MFVTHGSEYKCIKIVVKIMLNKIKTIQVISTWLFLFT